MSEFSAKTIRAARKAKASRMGSADPHTKVDSSDWTPAEPLNADVKTGARPLSRRAFKSGGKVSGEKAKTNMGRKPRCGGGKAGDSWVNRNVKEANAEREGKKHVGGFKAGGRAKRSSGGSNDAYEAAKSRRNAAWAKAKAEGRPGAYDKEVGKASWEMRKARAEARGEPVPKPFGDYDEKKHGGRTKREYGGRGPGERTQTEVARRDAVQAATDYGEDPRVTEDVLRQKTRAYEDKRTQTGYKKGGRTKKMDGGMMGMPMGDARLGMVQPNRMKFSGAQGSPYKKGGKVEHGDEAMDRALIKKMVKPSARTGKAGGGMLEDSKKALMTKSDPHNQTKIKPAEPAPKEEAEAKKHGGRTAHASGGKVKKGKTNINIIISTGKGQPQDGGPGLPPGLPGGPMSLQRPMGPPPGMPPMPPGMPAGGPPGMGQPPMPPMARKSGGRVTKVASSYKDMEAGAASGEGRLQKTDIAKRIPKKKEDGVIETDKRGYPNKVIGATGGRTAHKAGGKVYRSYKDMDAGAGSGMGRLEKEEIQKRKH